MERPHQSMQSSLRARLTANPPLALAVALGLFQLAVLPPVIATLDERSMAAVAEAIAERGAFDVPCGVGVPAADGLCYSPWYPLLSLLAVPLVWLAKALAAGLGMPERQTIGVLVPLVPALAAACAAGFTAALAQRMGASRRAAVLAGLAFALGTEVLVYSRAFYVETLGAMLAAFALWALTDPARRRGMTIAAVAALGLLVLTKPPLIVVGPACGLALAIHRRSVLPLIICTAGSLSGLVVYGVYNAIRFGDPLEFGGEARELTLSDYTPGKVLDAVGLFTISPGRGILIFSAVAVLGGVLLVRRWRDEVALCALLAFAALFAIYLGNPGMDINWGTRYLVPALPLLCVGVAFARGGVARLAVVLAVAGFVISSPSLVAPYYRHLEVARLERGSPSDIYWSIANGSVLGIWKETAKQLDWAAHTDVETLDDLPDEAITPTSTVPLEHRESLRIVFQWWWLVPIGGIPRLLGVLVALTFLAGAAFVLRVALGPHRPARDAPADDGEYATAVPAGADAGAH